MSALSDRLNQANNPKLSTRKLSERAKAAGFTLSHGTVSNALNGSHGHMDDDTLLGLEAALGVPFAEMRELLGLPRDAEPYVPPASASRLSHTQRDLLDALIHQLVRPVPVEAELAVVFPMTTTAEVSDPDESLEPAADDVIEDADEEPGGSEPNE